MIEVTAIVVTIGIAGAVGWLWANKQRHDDKAEMDIQMFHCLNKIQCTLDGIVERLDETEGGSDDDE